MDRRSIIFIVTLLFAFFVINHYFASNEPVPQSAPPQKKIKEAILPMENLSAPAIKPSKEEEFFVLQNDYQQIVFSNIGGAIAEINLPFKTKENTKSVVLPIRFDKMFNENYKLNDHFPSGNYYINNGSGIQKVENCQLGGYYPLLRRGVVQPNKPYPSSALAKYYGLNVTSETSDIANSSYTLKRLEKNLIEFEFADSDRKINKIFRFPEDPNDAPYCLEVSIRVDGDARGLWVTSGVPEVELISDSAAPAVKYMVMKKQKAEVEQLSLPKDCFVSTTIYPEWVSTNNGFFGLILDPVTPVPAGFRACKVSGVVDPTRLTLIDPQYQPYKPEDYPGYDAQLPLGQKTTLLRYYAGPLQTDILKKVDQTFYDPETGFNPNYLGSMSFHGWFTFISEPFAKFLFILMDFFHMVTHSWGFSIILLTIALRIMLYPLNAWSIKSTMKMQEIAPKITAIQEKYKKDPKRAQMEVISLYKEKGVNPLSGCFPLLIQLPFLIGMFDLLKSAFQLRGASFIPGWIDNLTAPDVLFSWNFPIIFFGTDFHLLPFLLGAVMWAQQKFSSTGPKDKSLMTDQQKQQKMMGNIMTIVFTVMFYHFPSGLNLYWLSSMALGILQQWFMTRRIAKNKTVVIQ